MKSVAAKGRIPLHNRKFPLRFNHLPSQEVQCTPLDLRDHFSICVQCSECCLLSMLSSEDREDIKFSVSIILRVTSGVTRGLVICMSDQGGTLHLT